MEAVLKSANKVMLDPTGHDGSGVVPVLPLTVPRAGTPALAAIPPAGDSP
ncbi:hypothetical protein [Lichenicoccus sp.]